MASSVKSQVNDIRKQVAAMQRATREIMRGKIPQKIERTLTAVTVAVANKGQEYTPLAYSLLQNSQFRTVEATPTAYIGSVGYTQEYALPLHSPKPGGKMDGWKPMDPYTRELKTKSANNYIGGGSGGWNPNATQDWLNIAAREEKATIDRIVIEGLQL